MLAILAYLVAVIALGRWLDIRAGKVDADCINERPSTAVAAWSWLELPILALWVLS